MYLVKKVLLSLVILLSLFLFGIAVSGIIKIPSFKEVQKEGDDTKIVSPSQLKMKITSPSFGNNQPIPSKFTCDGENINPELVFSDIPKDTKSLSLIVDDPDAPGGTFVHWVVWNINPQVTKIEEGSVPQGAFLGTNDFGKREYKGPCPPSGTHRYFFKLYALSEVLDLNEGATKKQLEKAMQGKIIDKAEIIATYKRGW